VTPKVLARVRVLGPVPVPVLGPVLGPVPVRVLVSVRVLEPVQAKATVREKVLKVSAQDYTDS
jgi:hypothetical protein